MTSFEPCIWNSIGDYLTVLKLFFLSNRFALNRFKMTRLLLGTFKYPRITQCIQQELLSSHDKSSCWMHCVVTKQFKRKIWLKTKIITHSFITRRTFYCKQSRQDSVLYSVLRLYCGASLRYQGQKCVLFKNIKSLFKKGFEGLNPRF